MTDHGGYSGQQLWLWFEFHRFPTLLFPHLQGPKMERIASPRTDDVGIESLIQTKGKTALRVTPADIEANIASEHYFTAAEGVGMADPEMTDEKMPQALKLLTFCVLVLKNGFTVTGQSACVSPENFDDEIGRRVALQNAKNQIWPLLGYELCSKLNPPKLDFKERVVIEHRELKEKLNKLAVFLPTELFKSLSAEERERLEAQLAAMSDYEAVLSERIAAF